ncbi:MAG: hypothetical protein K6A75_10935 [Ruminococcus sp.]|nr:hypothetical protein [Ruminococcus sp.]
MTFLLDMLGLYVLILCFGAFISILTFVKDVSKWHRAEKKVRVTPSALQSSKESEVIEHERNDSDPSDTDRTDEGQPSAPTVFSSWL